MPLGIRTYFPVLIAAIAFSLRAAAPGPVVVNDEFAGTTLSRHWSVRSGQWTARNGTLTNAGPGGRVLCGDLDWQSYQVTVRMRTTQPGPKSWSVG